MVGPEIGRQCRPTTHRIDELIKANRTSDVIIAPNRTDGLTEPYFNRRLWGCFGLYLMGAMTPDNYEITRPPDAAGGHAAGAPDDDDDPASGR